MADNANSEVIVPSSTDTDSGSLQPPVIESKGVKLDELGKIIRNFKHNVKNWPIHLSYEGSAVLCVILALNEKADCLPLSRLPKADQELLHKSLGGAELTSNLLEVKFDPMKDFILTFEVRSGDTTERREIVAFNTVAHPRPEDLKDSTSVKIEENGETFNVGGKITLNKKNIPRLVGLPETAPVEETRQPMFQANRNAYEIRADVLQMAVKWGMRDDFHGDEDAVLKVAKKFYAFVENKR